MKKDSFSFLSEIALPAEEKKILNMAVSEPNLKLSETAAEDLEKVMAVIVKTIKGD